MKKWQKIITKLALMAFLMLSAFSVATAQNKKYNPFYYPELSKYADPKQMDFSTEYKQWLTPDASQTYKDITNDILRKGYDFERTLFNSEQFIYEDMDGRVCYYKQSSFNGILGDNYARIEIYINPQVERTDTLTYGVYCHIDEDNKKVCLDIDLGGGDGYNQRNYVGTWQSYKTNATKRCIWGEYRLPYTFDFDIGDGEMRINPKYNSPEWEQWQSEFFNPEEKISWWEDSLKGGKQ